jgi:phosphoribosyl-ATP pyrophosphohydrolase
VITDRTSLVNSVDFAKGGGVVPTVVCDAVSGGPRMLAYSTRDSLESALRHGAGIYWSRSRGRLWRKGATSGNTQRLVRVVPDCDRDALIFYVEQSGPSCHLGAQSCFDGEAPFTWATLSERLRRQAVEGDASSYTRQLLSDDSLLAAKLTEEAAELAEAQARGEVIWECADLLYFMTVKMRQAGIGIADVMSELERRAR